MDPDYTDYIGIHELKVRVVEHNPCYPVLSNRLAIGANIGFRWRSSMRMRQQYLTWIALTAAAVLPVIVLGQNQGPRTPWGEPDLQGIWSNPYATPLQRPAQFGSREFLTPEEV